MGQHEDRINLAAAKLQMIGDEATAALKQQQQDLNVMLQSSDQAFKTHQQEFAKHKEAIEAT